MNKSSVIFMTLVSVLLFSNNLFAVTVQTNMEGVVIKEFECSGGNVSGNIVNRTNQSLTSNLAMLNTRLNQRWYVHIKSIDSDGDPIGQCIEQIELGPKSGDRFLASDCNCGYAKSYEIKVSPRTGIK